MSVRRTMKRAIYGVLYALLFLGFAALVIMPLLPEKAPVVVQVTQTPFIPVSVENIVVLPHTTNPGPFGKTIDVVARIKNENVRAGTGDYPVTLVVKDATGAVISSVDQAAYVLPGGVQYLAFLSVPIPSDKEFKTVEIQTPKNTELTQLPDAARLPDFSVFLRDKTQVQVGTQRFEQQTGIVTNNSTFDWEKVEVTSVALDTNGNIVGIGKTFVGKLLLGEQREFTLAWPVPNTASSRVVAIATTNIYSDENVVHIIGDPSKLR
jgi:hypothetical protein